MLKIRRPLGRLIFNMGIAIPGKTVFLIETAPWQHQAIILTRLFITEIMWYSPERNFPVSAQAILYNELENYAFKIADTFYVIFQGPMS